MAAGPAWSCRSVRRVSEPVTDSLVRARGLTKRFGSLTGGAGVDFEVEPGELVGFLGPNGAGKSSIMRMIGCVSPVSGGELNVLGMDPGRQGPGVRAPLGVFPREGNRDPDGRLPAGGNPGAGTDLPGEPDHLRPVFRYRPRRRALPGGQAACL